MTEWHFLGLILAFTAVPVGFLLVITILARRG